ncbi:MAG: 2-oxoacid:acceptor oxidoreductase subunit alpha [Candidatus Aminicenantes bacterium]|nr:2-oxoacid:acceptor oxidoreductase subunit alpha [Candidatus Aminicenantes bacterium]
MSKRQKNNQNCDVSIRIGGEAGQGMNVISGLLGKVFLRSGFWVFTHHDIMSRIRGGHNFSQIRFSTSPIRASSSQVQILVCLDKNTVNLYKDEIKGVVIFDLDKAEEEEIKGKKYLPIPLEKIAKEKGGDIRMANSVASGAVLAVLGFSLEPLLDLLKESFKSKGDKVVKANLECAREGYQFAKENFKGEKICGDMSRKKHKKRILITGSEAMALGALVSDLRFYSAYPMSPATAIMVYLASKQKEYGLIVEQAEDEISAVNMAIGASFAGARAMTATSGGGLALMVEGISLAGMTETPLVIVDCQRPAPATGLPTRTEQADLLFVAHCGHGEFPRVIFAPSSAEEAFSLSQKAFYLAEKYQIPVFILGDQYLNDSSWTENPFKLNNKYTTHQSFVSNKDLEDINPYQYKRYKITKSGISPRILPGIPDQVIYADSDEHTEEGHITESAEVRKNMVNKRLKKMKGLEKEMSLPKIFPDEKAEKYVVSWGSTLGVVEEAVQQLREKDFNIGYIHFSEIYPMRKDSFPPEIKEKADLITVENNATGQFSKFLRMETGISIEKKLLKYDGRPFSPQELVQLIEKKR